ncbi:MAG: carbohydrate ABC transporter permease [Fibrobacterota bacterium]
MKESRSKKIFWFLCLLIAVFITLMPVFFMFKYSISDTSSIVTGGAEIPLWPNEPTLMCYRGIMEDYAMWKAVFSSLRIAATTIFFSTLLGVPASYILARYDIPAKWVLLVGLLSIRLFPDIASIVPVVETFIIFGLENTHTGTALAHSLLALPYVVYICMGVFRSIPPDLEQQAVVMGSSKFTAFYKIILPLAIPGIAAAVIYVFLLSWDEFIFSYFLLGFGEINTLTLYLKHKLVSSPMQNQLAAISMVLSLPVIVFTIIVQKYIQIGSTSGAVK